MIVSARGVAVRTVKYGDSRLIVHLYTDTEGMRGFVVRTGPRLKPSLFFPLSQVEISYIRKGSDTSGADSELPYLRSVRHAYPYRTLYTDIRKNTMAMFMAEVLSKCVKEPLEDAVFFEKIWGGLRELDAKEEGFADFHLCFLMEITRLLGVYPFQEGAFPTEVMQPLARLTKLYEGGAESLSRLERRLLLKALSDYCRLHSGVEAEFKSLEVLEEVFR